MKDALFQVSLASFCFFLGITLLSLISFIKDKTLPVKWAKVEHFSLYSLPTHKGRHFSFCYVRCPFFFSPIAWGDLEHISCSAPATQFLLWVSVVILSLLWWFCPFSDHPVPSVIFLLFWVYHMQLTLIIIQKNSHVPA